jgi:hypothetical protein
VADVLQKISHRVIRKLRQLGYAKRVAPRRWRPAMTPWWRTHPNSPARWPLRCSNAWLLGSGRARRSDARRGLGQRGRGAHADRSPRCQRPGVFAARPHPHPRTPA